MINKLINKEDINLNDIVNYIFIKQNNFNTYCKKFEKDLKKIRKEVKLASDKIKINYIKEDNNIKFVSYETIEEESKTINIIFIGFEDIKYFDEYKQYLKSEYNNYKINIKLTKFHILYSDLLNDDYFSINKNIKTLEVYESKLNKLKYRMNQDIIVMPLENYQLDEYKEIHISKFKKTKKIKNLVVIYNNEMIGYFDYIPTEELNEIVEYKINENIKDKEVVIGKALIHIFDNHGKFNNIKVSIDNDFELNDFLKCGFLIVEELTVFSNK